MPDMLTYMKASLRLHMRSPAAIEELTPEEVKATFLLLPFPKVPFEVWQQYMMVGQEAPTPTTNTKADVEAILADPDLEGIVSVVEKED